MKSTLVPRLAALLGAIAIPALTLPATAFEQNASPAPASQGASSSAKIPELSKTGSERVEQHIKELHDQLHITAVEEPSWAQFAQVMRDNAAQMEQALTQRGRNLAGMNATETMQSYAQLAQLHATNMQKLASTFQALYSAFPSSQKQIADTVFRMRATGPSSANSK